MDFALNIQGLQVNLVYLNQFRVYVRGRARSFKIDLSRSCQRVLFSKTNEAVRHQFHIHSQNLAAWPNSRVSGKMQFRHWGKPLHINLRMFCTSMLVDFCAPLINTKGNAQKKTRTSMTLDRFQSLCDLVFVGPTAMLVACCGVPIYVTVRVSFKMNLNISCFYSGGNLVKPICHIFHYLIFQWWFPAGCLCMVLYLFLPMFASVFLLSHKV